MRVRLLSITPVAPSKRIRGSRRTGASVQSVHLGPRRPDRRSARPDQQTALASKTRAPPHTGGPARRATSPPARRHERRRRRRRILATARRRRRRANCRSRRHEGSGAAASGSTVAAAATRAGGRRAATRRLRHTRCRRAHHPHSRATSRVSKTPHARARMRGRAAASAHHKVVHVHRLVARRELCLLARQHELGLGRVRGLARADVAPPGCLHDGHPRLQSARLL